MQPIGVRPERCVVVEDAITGVRAAKAAGARCLALTTSFTPDALEAAGADWVAGGLNDVSPDLLLSRYQA